MVLVPVLGRVLGTEAARLGAKRLLGVSVHRNYERGSSGDQQHGGQSYYQLRRYYLVGRLRNASPKRRWKRLVGSMDWLTVPTKPGDLKPVEELDLDELRQAFDVHRYRKRYK